LEGSARCLTPEQFWHLPEGKKKKIMTADEEVRLSTVCLPHGNQQHQLSAADICGYE